MSKYNIDLMDRHKMDDYAIEVNRPYEKYKNHVNSLVKFGSISKFLADKYLKNFINEEHTHAIVYDIGYNRIKELFTDIDKEDFDDIMIGYLMVADLGIKVGKEKKKSVESVVEDNKRIDHNLYLRGIKEVE